MMKNSAFMMIWLVAAGSIQPALAAPESPAARYEADKKLCADESSSSLRMQCLRDARQEYDKARTTQKAEPAPSGKVACPECGKVISVAVGERKGEGSAVGMIGGGIAGALLGNQVGRGTGKTLATVAGAAGGAYAGNVIEQNVKTTKFWTVRVHLDTGEERSVHLNHDPGLIAGDLVTLSGNKLTRR